MTVGELVSALRDLDPDTVVVIAQSRREGFRKLETRDMRSAKHVARETIGSVRLANETFYNDREIGDPVEALVISAGLNGKGGDGK